MNDRLAIGANNPPAVDQFALHIEDLFALVSGSTAAPITTDQQEADLDKLLDDIRKARKDAEAQRTTEKQPYLDAGRDIDAAWKPNLARCDAALAALKGALTPWRNAKQKAKDDAAAKARDEAAAEQAKAQAALKQSDDLEARFEAEAQIERAAKLVAVANRIDRSATGLRSYQIADVTDRRELLAHVMKTDPDALGEWLAEYARKALPACLPGVTIRTEKRAA